MFGQTVGSAISVLVFGSLFATLCDVVIKLVGADVAIFQFSFWRAAFMCVLLLPIVAYLRATTGEKFSSKGIKVHILRGNLWVLAAVLLVVSLSELPLATANAVFYTSPLFIVLFAGLLYREKLGVEVLAASILGFAGVLLILRPTHISLGMVSAILFAVVLAANSLLIKKLPKQQSMFYGLFVTQLCALPMAGGLAFWEGEPIQKELWVYAALSSICSIVYSVSCLVAYRYVESSKVASAEYSGLIFAMLFGWWVFGETPDLGLFVGSLMIILPLLYLGKKQSKKNAEPAPLNSI
ncbi:DMT family transporter [Marinomonas epiphytica]